MAAAIRAVLGAVWRRRWMRAAVVGLTPPFVPTTVSAHGADSSGPAIGAENAVDGFLSQSVCELLRASEMVLRLPRAECPQVSLSLGLDGWMWRITPIHVAWAVLAALVLCWAARRDWGRTMDSPTVRVGWEAAKTVGLAYVLKMVASAMIGVSGEIRAAAEVLR